MNILVFSQNVGHLQILEKELQAKKKLLTELEIVRIENNIAQ